MNLNLLQALTWSTVAGAFVSALALAAIESSLPRAEQAATPSTTPLPTEPTAAGPQPQPAASAADRGIAKYVLR